MAKRSGSGIKKATDKHVRTWVELSRSALAANYQTFRNLISPKVKLWSVVKSNAYGHGLMAFSHLADRTGVDGFCVDSLVEGVRLRKEGIKKPILVTGHTLPALYPEAAAHHITIAISAPEGLLALQKLHHKPEVHIKIDTGMHRHGFYPEDAPRLVRELSKNEATRQAVRGIFTHFASAKDINYPTYTERQFASFIRTMAIFEQAGFTDIIRHCSATAGTLISPKYHLDAVRIGIGLYGLFPSKELELQLPHIKLRPVLSWRTIVAEVKKIKAGSYVGYDLTERMPRSGAIAILPIGYWHGYPWTLSGKGEVLVRGIRRKVIGRVSMDIMAIDASKGNCRPEDVATLIGREGREQLLAADLVRGVGGLPYEFLTRLNPLMERVITK